jgi:C4-dicarboxylate-specific signal transduction histidine kinase
MKLNGIETQEPMRANIEILVVDDDLHLRNLLAKHLTMRDSTPLVAANGTQAMELLMQHDPWVAIVDLLLPDYDGLKLIQDMHTHNPLLQCIVLSGYAELAGAVETIRDHVYDYMPKPVTLGELELTLARAVEHARLVRAHREDELILTRRSEELENSLRALQEAQDRLIRTANAALMGQLAEGLRHELGNALTTIRLNMNLLTHYREDPARYARHMNSLEQGVRAIERIAFALRSFPTTEGQIERLDLITILRQAAKEAQQASDPQTSQISLSLVGPAAIQGSYFQLVRAFVGIVENAIEASAQIYPERPQVWIAVESYPDSQWKVSIRDNGSGLTSDALDHATEPGFTTKVERGFMLGLGLGLFVASTVIDRHGGQLRLTNAPEGGALVEVWLPQAEPVETAGE